MNHPSTYRHKHVVILGLAKSGVSAAKWFAQLGAHVIVNDHKSREQCPEAEELEQLGIPVICGEHPDTLVHAGIDLIVKNPGIPYHIAPLQQALALGIEIITEVEVAYQLSQAPMIGITGSNGKTTTTTLIGQMLDAGHKYPIVAGNIGRPLIEAVAEAEAHHWLVVELSSFQLKGTATFRPRIGVLLNLYETHLDYHGSIQDYMTSKLNLFHNQTSTDIAVLNADDAFCQSVRGQLRAEVMLFSRTQQLASGVYVELATDRIVYRQADGQTFPVISCQEIGIPGSYNVENAMAAICVALRVGVEIPLIAQVLRDFRGVEHRLEFVRQVDERLFYNNSKATNPAATIKSIEAFDRPVILLAGGLDRGSDYLELLPIFRERVKAIVTFGQTSAKLSHVAQLAGVAHIASFADVTDPLQAVAAAVQQAKTFAERGDVVLLSPACASWDMFTSYEQRGSMFKQVVHSL